MAKKLMTLQELADYLEVSEEKVNELIEKKVVIGYKLGGELLRFRKEQIDAIRSAIDSRLIKSDRVVVSETRKRRKEKLEVASNDWEGSNFSDRIIDFFYFNDFYIISGLVIAVLLLFIFKG
ncbi:MAG: helix-turn-helix domain-containing protein [Candidatus Omnitrophota bacterium]